VRLGYLGEIAPDRLDGFGLRGACSAAELEFDALRDRADLIPSYRPLPPFPAVARDLSLVVPADLPWAELADAARWAAGNALEALTYLDTYRGAGIPEGRQSIHFGLRFRHPDRTLTGDEVERAVKAVVGACAARFGATLRT
jgi:phenylalanyl-tRNA synthetase beta chain